MSSKLHRGGAAVSAPLIVWPSAGGGIQPVSTELSARNAAAARPNGSESTPSVPDAEWEARVSRAYQQGQAAGESAAAQRANSRVEPALAALNGMVKELVQLRPSFRAKMEEGTVQLAIAIARRVLYRELSTDPEAILGLVKAAFLKCDARETHRLRVSSLDAPVLQENRVRLDFPPGLEIISDASLTRGSALFETERGDLDASIDTQLGEIERGFADVLKRRSR